MEAHIAEVHHELQALFETVCKPDSAIRVPHPSEQQRGDINVPSCEPLQRAGLSDYYGNINMVLTEAWQWKILPAVLEQRAVHWWWRPRSDLITVHAPDQLRLAGAIFVQQLLADGAPTPAALMIGIHRMPAHKLLGRLPGTARPALIVTDALVERVKQWSRRYHIKQLFVCPYQELGPRLQQLGFTSVADPSLSFGAHPLRDLCEDGLLYVHKL